jgi:hypothetical protein
MNQPEQQLPELIVAKSDDWSYTSTSIQAREKAIVEYDKYAQNELERCAMLLEMDIPYNTENAIGRIKIVAEELRQRITEIERAWK